MNIIKSITAHEMARRFAVGEVNSQFFFSQDESIKNETLQFLTSGDYALECIGIQRHWESRGIFIKSLPKDTEWSLAKLRLSENEFAQLRTVNVDGWINYTSGSLRLVDAAIFLHSNPTIDPRVMAVISSCNQGMFEICGITLFGQSFERPLTIVEGTARLVTLYLNYVQKKSCLIYNNEIEVVVGLSHSNWCFS
ncbi:MAG: hypothetical protein NTW65_03005 [Deltaproteobacteria bacterium]|nr:hypothetical protein [Deltaproteobacteria bacterium]